MELNKYIGDKIKRFRESRSLTQDELAEKLGTTRQSVSRYETGDRKANQDVLFDLAEIFNVKVDDFFPARSIDTLNKNNTLMLIEKTVVNLNEDRRKNVLSYAEKQLQKQKEYEELEKRLAGFDERTKNNLYRYAETFGIDALDDLHADIMALDINKDDNSTNHNAG